MEKVSIPCALQRLSHPGRPVLAVQSRCSASPGCPAPTVLLQQSCLQLTCPSCPVISVMSWPSFFSVLSRLTPQADLFRLASPGYPVPFSHFLSCPRCPIPTVRSWLSCHGCLVPVMFQMYCPWYHVLVALSSLSCPAFHILTVFSGCPVPIVPYRLSRPNCRFPAILPQHYCSQLFCPCCPVFEVMFSSSYHICFVPDVLS